MLSVSSCFQSLRVGKASRLENRHRCALIPFITAGDPDLATTAAALKTLDAAGADLIELGVPYSDPLADGPVIQAAATRALARGVKLDDVINMVAEVSPQIKAPIILFTYYNPILNKGVRNFLTQIAAAGVKGLVVPDLPLEEAEELLVPAAEIGIEVILLVAPTSSQERITAIAAKSQGFIYLVSVTGVTGVRSGGLDQRVKGILANIRSITDKPIAIGFGISAPEHAKQVQAWGADGVIVGSAMVKRLAEGTPNEGIDAIKQFCQSLRVAID